MKCYRCYIKRAYKSHILRNIIWYIFREVDEEQCRPCVDAYESIDVKEDEEEEEDVDICDENEPCEESCTGLIGQLYYLI